LCDGLIVITIYTVWKTLLDTAEFTVERNHTDVMLAFNGQSTSALAKELTNNFFASALSLDSKVVASGNSVF